MKDLLTALEKTKFDIRIDTWSDSIYVKNTYGNYFFGFVICYDIFRENDEDFTVLLNDITDIEVQLKGEVIDLDDDTLKEVIEILESKVKSQI